MSDLIAQCDAQQWRRVAFAGVSELVDVGMLCTRDCKVELAGIVDPALAGSEYNGLPVVATLAELGQIDAIIITDLAAPQAALRLVAPHIEPQRILSPRLLRIALPHLDSEHRAARALEK